MRKSSVVFIISLASVLFLGSLPCSAGWLDAVSGATRSAKEKGVTLPPDGEEYTVLGVLPGLKNYAVKYDEALYRGGELQKKSAVKTLRKLGVKTIVSITPTDYEREFCRKYRFPLVEIPFEKDNGISEEGLALFLETIRTGTGPFYLHCKGGSHRAGILGAAYRIFILNWPVERALTEYDRLGGDLIEDQPMIEALKRMAP